jgi:hypothetical protein
MAEHSPLPASRVAKRQLRRLGAMISRENQNTTARTTAQVLSLLCVMAFVAAGIFLVLKLGFIFYQDPQPGLIESRTITIVAVLVVFGAAIAAVALLINAICKALRKQGADRERKRARSAQAEARIRRVAELAADPNRAKYASLVEKGEHWSDENIAYFENPGRAATCNHLEPIERAIREAGIQVRLHSAQNVLAKCRIVVAELERNFCASPPVRYAEFYQGDRYEFEHPTAFLICDEHKSIIHTLHPDEAEATDAPEFPWSEE